MVEKRAVFDAANALYDRGEKPTVRRVTVLLPTGGSPNDVSRLLKEWTRDQQEGKEPRERPCPPDLSVDLQDFMSKVWIASNRAAEDAAALARQEATELNARTDGLLIELESANEAKDTLIETLQRQLDHAQSELERERNERQSIQYLLTREKDLVKELERRHATDRLHPTQQISRTELAELWRRIGSSAIAILRKESPESMSVKEILAALPNDLLTECRKKLRKLDVKELREYLDRKVKRGDFIKSDITGKVRKFRYETNSLS